MIETINKKEEIYSIIKEKFGVDYKDNPFTHWYIYEEDNELLGFINMDIKYDKSELVYIYVKEEYRNKGIATKLLNEAITDLKQKEVINITLEVNENNQKAINFYLKNGFKTVALRENYYGKENGLLMLKSW